MHVWLLVYVSCCVFPLVVYRDVSIVINYDMAKTIEGTYIEAMCVVCVCECVRACVHACALGCIYTCMCMYVVNWTYFSLLQTTPIVLVVRRTWVHLHVHVYVVNWTYFSLLQTTPIVLVVRGGQERLAWQSASSRRMTPLSSTTSSSLS